MNLEPKIDIVMPVRNAEATLGKCLTSIENQTFADFRLVAVNDGSSDSSEAMLNDFADSDSRCSVIANSGEGIVDALNTGLAQCNAPFIARMDADDTMHPQRLEKQLNYLKANKDVGVAGCLVNEKGFDGGFEHYLKWSNGLTKPDDIARARFIESPIVHPTVMFRRELIEQHGGYRNGDFPEDYELWLRWMDAGVQFGKVNETLLSWSDHDERLTRTDPRYSVDAFYEIKFQYLAKWLKQNSPQKNRVWIWGAGPATRKRIRKLVAHDISIEGFIDVDPEKIGHTTMDGKVYAPDELPGPENSFVLSAVGSRGARELIVHDLTARGYIEGTSFFCVA